MRKSYKLLFIVAILLLSLFNLMGCNSVETNPKVTDEQNDSKVTTEQSPSQTTAGQKDDDYSLMISIYNKENENIYSETIKTKETNLFEILNNTDDLKLVSEDSEGGKFIVSILDITYGDSYYWSCYINGEYYADNITLYEIKNNDVIEFHFEKVG